MQRKPVNSIIILVGLILLTAACSPLPALLGAASGTRVAPAGGETNLEQTLQVLTTRTPAPTPTPGPGLQAMTGVLESMGVDEQEFLGLNTTQWASIIAGIVIFLLIYFVGLWLVRAPLRWLVRRTPTEFDDQFFPSVSGELKLLVLVFSLDFIMGRSTVISADAKQNLGDIFFILYLIIFASILWRLIRFTERWYKDEFVERVGEERYDTIAPLILRSTAVVLVVFIIAILLDHFGFQVSSFMFIGLFLLLAYIAVKFVISDAASGFIILFDQPFRVGDRVKIDRMDTWGDVVEIGTRTTRIHTLDNRLVVIPNSEIANQKLDNYTYPDPTFRMHLDVGIKFGSDVRQVQDIISRAVAHVEGVLPDKPPEVLLIEFGESGLTFRVRWWVVTQTDFYIISNLVNLAMIDALGKAGIEISFTTINVINLDPGSSEANHLAKPTRSVNDD